MDFAVVLVGAGMGMGFVKSYEFPVMVKIHILFTIKTCRDRGNTFDSK